MSNEEILTVIDQRNEDLKELMEKQAKLTTAEIQAMGDVLKIEMKRMHEKQDKTNGSLGNHEGRIVEVENTLKPQAWMKRNWKAAAAIFVLSAYLIHSAIEKISITDLFKLMK